jgi:hypothetical protein
MNLGNGLIYPGTTSHDRHQQVVQADYQSQQKMELRFSQMATLYYIKLSANKHKIKTIINLIRHLLINKTR